MKRSYIAPTLILLTLTLLSGLTLASTSVSADDVVDNVTITVPMSCTMSGNGMTSHTASIPNGTYNSSIGETTMKAFCNDHEGFAIYAIGYTDEEDGKNVLTSSALGSTSDITTSTATSGNNSAWAMKLAIPQSPTPTYPMTIQSDTEGSFSSFHTVPDDYTLVAKRTSSTDIGQNAEGSSLTTTYQAYISQTQPAGTYTGKVKYTMVHPHDATKPHKKIYMQDLTSTTIAQLLPNTHDTAIVVDKRDEQEYTIAKLADGKYWMTENLNIAGGTALSSEDTDFDSSYTLPTTDGWTVTDGKLVVPASAIKNENDNNLTDNTQFSLNTLHAYVFNSGNTTSCSNNNQSIPCYSYYSWDAATLGSERLLDAPNTDASYSICPKGWRLPTSGTTNDDGWKRGDFYTLATAYGANVESSYRDSTTETGSNFYNNAGPLTVPRFQMGGYYWDGNFTSGGGHYLASTTYGGSWQMQLNLYTDSVYTTDTFPSGFGMSIRCLFKAN